MGVQEVHFEKEIDWEDLRRASLLPGGFGSQRTVLWPKLLNVKTLNKTEDKNEAEEIQETKVHPDERQIKLDTERSFVLYSVEDAKESRESLQSELHTLLVSIFRKRPKLSYFQGYHDIITVLFLTLPPELQLACAEQLSLQRVRDSMGATLEPVLGLLRITSNLLRVVDPSYAAILEGNSPLPFYALSNLLTLFSHDMPTLPLIQHVFDYILCRPPIIIVYLATVIILSRKNEVEWLEQEGEAGMIHSLLNGLPGLYDHPEDVFPSKKPEEAEAPDAEPNSVDDAKTLDGFKLERPEEHQERDVQIASSEPRPEITADAMIPDNEPVDVSSSIFDESIDSDIAASSTACSENGDEDHGALTDDTEVTKLSHSHQRLSSTPPPKQAESDPDTHTINPSTRPPSVHSRSSSPDNFTSRRPTLSLSSLLLQADALYASHPPTDPALSVSSIMGPQSVVFTWTEDPALLPDADTAESIVTTPELIVRPFIEPEEPHSDSDREEGKEKHKGGKRGRRWRRKLKKPHRLGLGHAEGRVVVASAVLVLGVAMAIYGTQVRSPGSHTGHLQFAHEWRRVGKWVGGVLVGASERIVDGFALW